MRRIRLRWNRNQDAQTSVYEVYRTDSTAIIEQNKKDFLVMRVAHPKNINPITVHNELPERISPKTYKLAHRNILTKYDGTDYNFHVRVDDVVTTAYTLDTLNGTILFDNEISPTSIVLAEEYTFDGVEAWDYNVAEEGKLYYGPEAKDSSPPNVPSNVTLTIDEAKNRITLGWKSSTVTGKSYSYRIDAATEDDQSSLLSEQKTVEIKEPLMAKPYIIERSDDGKKWVVVSRVQGNAYDEYMIDRDAPSPVQSFNSRVTMLSNQSLANITLTWAMIQDTTPSQTAMYRVRASNRAGAVSEPSSIVGPLPFKTPIKEIIIRRKIYDGTLPTMTGSESKTIAIINNISEVSFSEDVTDNKTYIYGIWLRDNANNASIGAYSIARTSDATAPTLTSPTIVAEAFSLGVG